MPMIYWGLGARLKGFTTASRSGPTTIKIELVATDPWAVASIIESLQACQGEEAAAAREHAAAAAAARRRPAARPVRLLANPQLALPAPRND